MSAGDWSNISKSLFASSSSSRPKITVEKSKKMEEMMKNLKVKNYTRNEWGRCWQNYTRNEWRRCWQNNTRNEWRRCWQNYIQNEWRSCWKKLHSKQVKKMLTKLHSKPVKKIFKKLHSIRLSVGWQFCFHCWSY